jgi:RNA polymerase sigma-70 factor (ECF subfamily)
MEATQDAFEQGPQGILEKQNMYSKAQNTINKLPEKFHAVVVLSYFEELSLEEIAHLEECPVGTVKSRVFRGQNRNKGPEHDSSGRILFCRRR